jgi:hypothetical protein
MGIYKFSRIVVWHNKPLKSVNRTKGQLTRLNKNVKEQIAF